MAQAQPQSARSDVGKRSMRLIAVNAPVYRVVGTDGVPASVGTVLDCWREGDDLGLKALLHDLSTPVFWEHPPWRADRLKALYECVLLPAPSLDRMRADRESFAEHFENARADICDFSSLGKDAHLIAPVPAQPTDDFTHLTRFAQNAQAQQYQALFRKAASVIERILGEQPRWVSTSGLGVGWLHLRLDTRPKYYQYAPYRSAGA